MQKYWKPEKLFWYIFYFEYFFPRKKIKYFTFSESLILMIFPGKYLQFDVVLSTFLVWEFFIKILELLIEEKIFVTLLRLAVMLRLYNINITVVILMWILSENQYHDFSIPHKVKTMTWFLDGEWKKFAGIGFNLNDIICRSIENLSILSLFA